MTLQFPTHWTGSFRALVVLLTQCTLRAIFLLSFSACNIDGMDPENPARGPGQLVGNGEPVSDGSFAGGNDPIPSPRSVEAPAVGSEISCDVECRNYCESLNLQNPVNKGICAQIWGVGLQNQPILRDEACRRLFADTLGRYPTSAERDQLCDTDKWGGLVRNLLDSPSFVLVQQRRWADKLLYNNRAVNIERVYDMDELVEKTYRGKVSWDGFAAVTSAHPVLMRRLDSPSDRVDAIYRLFMGRPPYDNERADLSRLYILWENGYLDHAHLGRVPDSYIGFRCVNEQGEIDKQLIGECTSIGFGHHTVVLKPDRRTKREKGEQEGLMWTGYLSAAEWELLQTPGRVIASEPAFWESVVDDALETYFGYNLGTVASEVREELIRYLLQYNGDIRSLHFAIATSIPYLQSATGGVSSQWPWINGPLKQAQVETWIDSITQFSKVDLGQCDHRISYPEDFLEEESTGWARALLRNSRWPVDDNDELQTGYRNLARTLGGCPSNEVSGRFSAISILNTAVQEGLVIELCNPGGQRGRNSMNIGALLPVGVDPKQKLDVSLAQDIARHQVSTFFSRQMTATEIEQIDIAANACTPAPCNAEIFARPLCFALVSGAEMLFY